MGAVKIARHVSNQGAVTHHLEDAGGVSICGAQTVRRTEPVPAMRTVFLDCRTCCAVLRRKTSEVLP